MVEPPLVVVEDLPLLVLADVVIQLGAILAVVVIYWKKLWPFGKQDNPHPMAQTGFGACLKKDILQMWCKVIVATVPAAVIGLLLDDWSQAHLYNAWTVVIMLILFGIAFIWIEKWHKNRTNAGKHRRNGAGKRILGRTATGSILTYLIYGRNRMHPFIGS